jgi:general secretion pathway protein D
MMKTYISTLLIVLLAGAHVVQAQESLDDVFAQLDAANDTGGAVTETQAAATYDAVPASVVDDAVGGTSEGVTVAQTSADNSLWELYQKGNALYSEGEYDKAMLVYDAVLVKDPYYSRAVTMQKRTAQRIAAKEVQKQSATRSRAIAHVDASWNQEPKVAIVIDTGDTEKPLDPRVVAIQQMEARLKGIMIPSLDFRDANIKDVVLFLTETCRRLDAQGKGVNILLLGMDRGADENNITISIRDMSLYEALQYIVEMASLKFEVKPSVVAISPVNYVAEVDMILKSYDVIVEVGADMEALSGSSSGGGADDLFGDASAGAVSGGPTDVSKFFSIVEFPEGSSAVYQPRFHKLFVKNTPKNIQMVEDILADLEDEAIKKRSQQVEIEAKFVEFNEGAMEELGFDWTLYDNGEVGGFGLSTDGSYYQRASGVSGTGSAQPDGSTIYTTPVDGLSQINQSPGQSLLGTAQRSNSSGGPKNLGAFEALQSGILASMGGSPAAMVFSNTGSFPVDLRISAMEQEGTADVLSAPKVTTKSGNEAIIRIVEVHRYPQDYDVETGQRTAPVVKPQDWEDYDLGVVLKVTPVVDADSNTIDLDLAPEITKFKGYDNYVVGYNAYESGGNNQSELFGDGSALLARMPYFEKRTVQTQVTISDGFTVLMGGLVDERTETFRDQVPFLGDIPYLGRIFRTEGSRSSKKNLVIYVKATQVDDKGMTRADREMARQTAAK